MSTTEGDLSLPATRESSASHKDPHDNVRLLREAAIAHDVDDGDLHGFSILRRNSATGEWVCDVFVVRMRGTLVDNDKTMTFGHEMLHCFGLRHDE